jgi:hypothetical protein
MQAGLIPFVETCAGRDIAGRLQSFACAKNTDEEEVAGAEQALRPDDVLKQLLRTFTNLRILTLNGFPFEVTSIETVQLLGAMQHLTYLQLWGSNMFYGGDRDRIDEWLRVFPPYFPKTLKRIDLSGRHCMH